MVSPRSSGASPSSKPGVPLRLEQGERLRAGDARPVSQPNRSPTASRKLEKGRGAAAVFTDISGLSQSNSELEATPWPRLRGEGPVVAEEC